MGLYSWILFLFCLEMQVSTNISLRGARGFPVMPTFAVQLLKNVGTYDSIFDFSYVKPWDGCIRAATVEKCGNIRFNFGLFIYQTSGWWHLRCNCSMIAFVGQRECFDWLFWTLDWEHKIKYWTFHMSNLGMPVFALQFFCSTKKLIQKWKGCHSSCTMARWCLLARKLIFFWDWRYGNLSECT